MSLKIRRLSGRNDSMMAESFTLERFVMAQDPLWGRVLSELQAGSKRTHWMWFVFPQIQGLGYSDMARRYAIASGEEARAYLNHSILGSRLREATVIVNSLENFSVEQIFGYPDNLKFHSSMTLFAQVTDGDDIFTRALDIYFQGKQDNATLMRL
ncbi:uncharacterized protein (DUF1810 family) [Pseudomonas duriflava]|uniref:Uncharacterized protein (DUF1810 family) n=1 Tax=Pseudomonas duriflava TaxID=459528 RepID=A0A562QQF5_9PSED|nr:DUF1810 domain-containing protein [Pseudomonas duriflava]TWI58306.1 uncharacterized protein (DUF1810 family) [Pseudomonas duriflava]